MQCLFCNGNLKDETVSFDEKVDEMLVTVVQAPARVCAHCGERYLSGQLLAAVERAVRQMDRGVEQRRVLLSAERLLG